MKPPCVIVVYYVLPAIRAIVAQKLVEKYNLRQVDAAARMGVAPAAVTQYVKGKRGSSLMEAISQSERAVKIISDLAECLEREETPIDVILNKTCEACSVIRSERLICDMHQVELQALRECRCNLCENTVC